MAPWCTDLASSWPVLTFFYFNFFFPFLFFNLNLPIMLFSYFRIQFNIKTFEKQLLFNKRLIKPLLVYGGRGLPPHEFVFYSFIFNLLFFFICRKKKCLTNYLNL